MGIERGLAVVEQQARDVVGGTEGLQPPDLRRQGQAGPLGMQHQHSGNIRRVRHRPGAGPVCSLHAVVKAHSPFHQGKLRRLTAQCPPDAGLPLQKQVQIAAGHPQHLLVEHGVDVVWAALEGLNGHPPGPQRRQQGTGHHRLAAAAAHSGQHQPPP